MREDQILTVHDNNSKKEPKICIKSVHGNWIEFVKHNGDYTEINYHKKLPRKEFKFCVTLDYNDCQELGFDKLDTFEIDIFGIFSKTQELEKIKVDVALNLQNFKELIENGWTVESCNHGVIVLKTRLVYTKNNFDTLK